MRINVTGRPKHVSKKIAREAVKDFAARLMSKRLTDTLTINIKFVNDITASQLGRLYGLDNTDWAVMDYDPNMQDTRRPKEFNIELASSIKTEQKMLECLAHELVHVKQYARGELDYTRWDHLKRWHGVEVDFTKINYWDYPWEIEAYGREIGLVSRFLDAHHKHLNLPLTQQGRPTTLES